MHGLMQEHPLLTSSILRHAAKHHPGAKIVSVDAAGAVTRGTWPGLWNLTALPSRFVKSWCRKVVLAGSVGSGS